MHSSAEFVPARATNFETSELCSTCHTLYTTALEQPGRPAPPPRSSARFPEQVPYLEWRASAYAQRKDGQDLPGLPHDVHHGAGAGVQRAEPAARALRPSRVPGRQLLHAGHAGTLPRRAGGRGAAAGAEPVAAADAGASANGAPPRSPSRAPSFAAITWKPRSPSPTRPVTSCRRRTRRAGPGCGLWFATPPAGCCSRPASCAATAASRATTTIAIPLAFEPHHRVIETPEDVQIYESIMLDARGRVTTGLLSAVRYGKDNRLLPRGFDKATAAPDCAVQGDAQDDPDFQGGGDRVIYRRAPPGRSRRSVPRRRRAPVPADCVSMGPQSRRLQLRAGACPLRRVLPVDVGRFGGDIGHRHGQRRYGQVSPKASAHAFPGSIDNQVAQPRCAVNRSR